MRFSNLHTHSVFSDGKHTPEEIVCSAIDKDLISIGLSDHSDTPCDPSYCMKCTQYPEYFRTVRELKKKYADRIDVLLGIELDYYSEIDRSDLDYVIGSVHYLCEESGYCHPIDHSLAQQEYCIATLCGGDRMELARRYYDLLVRHTERTRPDVVGHFDVITKFGLFDDADPTYLRLATEAMDEVLKHCSVIEMNTGAVARKRRTLPYPAEFLLRRVLERGGEILLSADAHTAETIDFFFPESLDLLRRIGFDHVVYLDRNGLHRASV